MLSFEMNDRKKIGIGLTGFGVFFTFLGVIFLFDKGLLAMGNILFLSGLGLTIGLKSTMQFFMKPENFKGTFSFGIGFFFVVIGWPILGMILEAYGFIILFSGFLPTLVVFLQRIPLLGWVLQLPFIRSILNLLFLLLVSTIPITGQAGDVYKFTAIKQMLSFLLIDMVEDGCLFEVKSLRRLLMQDQLVTEFDNVKRCNLLIPTRR